MNDKAYTWQEGFKDFVAKSGAKGITIGEVFSHSKHPLRELFVASVFTCAMSKLTKREDLYFRLVEAKFPDFEVCCVESPEHVLKIENTQVPQRDLTGDKNISDQVYQRILSTKLKKYGNSSQYILCVYLRFNGTFNSAYLRQKLQGLQPSFGQVWVLFRTIKETWRCEEVWPESQCTELDLVKECKKFDIRLIIKSLKRKS